MAETLLVDEWYARPVGHAIEALRRCLGYHKADPTLSVSVLMNGATAFELAHCCPFIDRVYPVPYTGFLEPDGDPRVALAHVPREWDWVVDNHRVKESGHDRFRGFRRFFNAAAEHFDARRGHGISGEAPPAYEPHHELRLELPAAARSAAASLLQGREAIAVVLAGSGPRALYPSVSSWELILTELRRRFPEATLFLIGRLDPGGARSTTTVERHEVERLVAATAAVDCFDRPLLGQLALVEASGLFISPHTGFGFAAVSVGTPWLAISGGQWHEMFFNGVPFYSVIPDTDRYESFGWGGPIPLIDADEDGEGPRTPSMCAARIREDLPELLDAAERLLDDRLSYEQALTDYFPRLLAAYKGDRPRVFSFDNIHHAYI